MYVHKYKKHNNDCPECQQLLVPMGYANNERNYNKKTFW
jgi:hypothetical protein